MSYQMADSGTGTSAADERPLSNYILVAVTIFKRGHLWSMFSMNQTSIIWPSEDESCENEDFETTRR
jgi:hypothetical protein